MPAAYSTGATQPLTPKDKSAHSRFRLGGASSSAHAPPGAGSESTTTPPDSPLRPRFLRRQHHQSSTKHGNAVDKIPWDSPSSPPKPPLGPPPPPPPAPPPSATRSQSDTALLQPRPSSELDGGGRVAVPPSPAKSVPSGKGAQAGGSSAGGGGGGGFRRLVTKGSKFSLRSTFAPLTGSHPHAREHSGSTTSPPTSPPLSSRFPSSSSAASFRSRSGSTDLRHQPFVGTRGFATYPREISSPTGSRVGPAPVALLLATPRPSPAEHDFEWASSATQDEGGPGRVGGKAARFLGEAMVPSGKAAKLLGMERKKTLVKKPSSTSLLTADLSDRMHRQSLVPTLDSSASSRPPTPHTHARQRSISVPVRYSPGALLGGLGLSNGSDGEYDDDFWRPATPLTPPSLSHLGPSAAFITSDYDGSSPTQTIENSPVRERRRAPSHSSSRDSFPQTARVTSYASSTFSPSGVPSFYPASSAAEPDWRNSTWSARPDSDDVSSGLALDPGPPRLPKPKRLSPESIRFSAIFAGRTSDLFSGTSASAGGSSSEAASVREGSSGAGARASTRPSMGSRATSYGSSGVAGSVRAAQAAELSRTGSPASWSTDNPSRFPTTAAPSTLSLPTVPPPASPLPTPPPSRTPPPPPPPSSRPPSSTCPHAGRSTQPRRSNTLLSVASSHTRRSQRSHALDALEGRPRRTRTRESSSASSVHETGSSVDAIGAMERRALEAGGLVRAASDDGGVISEVEGEVEGEEGLERGGAGAGRAAGEAAQLSRKSRPFLDLGWSSDEGDDVSSTVLSRRAKGAPLPPLPSSSSVADAAYYLGRPPATTSSALSFSTSSSSTSSHLPTRCHPGRTAPTVHLPPRPPPPPAPSPAPGAPLPPVPYPVAAPIPAPTRPAPRPKHARHASMQSSILSLSSSEDDDDVRGAREVVSAFPAPPPSRVGGGAGARR
ncbi:hypothetical protein JCM8208_004609 [Rhodotorula glutinis]